MTPSWTRGCASPKYFGSRPEPPRRARQTALRPATFSRVICRSGEYRRLKRSPPLVSHSVVGNELSWRPVNAGAGAIVRWPARPTSRCPRFRALDRWRWTRDSTSRVSWRVRLMPNLANPTSDDGSRCRAGKSFTASLPFYHNVSDSRPIGINTRLSCQDRLWSGESRSVVGIATGRTRLGGPSAAGCGL